VLAHLAPWKGWDAMYWFAGANVWLEDKTPIDLLDKDPAGVIQAASHAHDEISD